MKYNLKLFYLKSGRRKNVLQDHLGAVISEHVEKLLQVYNTVVTIRTESVNIQQFYVLPTHCIYVFCVDLRTNSDYLPIQH
jgi:hypothetical protein